MNNIDEKYAATFIKLMLLCVADRNNGVEITFEPPFGGRAKCRFEFEVDLPEDKK